MDAIKFEQLLLQSESKTLDFKRDLYDFSTKNQDDKKSKRIDFVKDIVSMANTPRETSSYIVMGVKASSDGERELFGVDTHLDDNTLQQQVEDFVYPHPNFNYIEVNYSSKKFGVIEIPIAKHQGGPFLPTEKVEGFGNSLRAKRVYLRRGSKNSEADHTECKAVYSWFNQDQVTPMVIGDESQPWKKLLNSVDLNSPAYRYILLLGLHDNSMLDNLDCLAGINWSLVVDFDTNSANCEQTKACIDLLSKKRSVHQVTKGDALPGNLSKSTTWYYARGIAGRETTQIGKKWNDWVKTFASDFKEKLTKVCTSGSDPVVVIALWDDMALTQHLARCLDDITELTDELSTKLIVSENSEEVFSIAENSESELINLSPEVFLEGIRNLSISANNSSGTFLPGKGGILKEVSPEDLAWLSEDLTVVHSTIGTSPPSDQDVEIPF
ncbi:ATP-binding protein [Pseudomonas fluorescens]|nr:ATP-binding protein [Pseudomonas fluorescens]